MNRKKFEPSFILSCIMSQGVWLVSAVDLLLAFSAVAVSVEDPAPLMLPLSLCALYLSSLLGGCAAVRFSGDGILSGIVSGAFTVVLTIFLSLLPLPKCGVDFPLSLIFELLTLPSAVIGAVIGKKKSKKSKITKNNPRKIL